MGVVIVEGKGQFWGVNVGRPIEPVGTLLCSCAKATRSSQVTLGGLVNSVLAEHGV